MSNFTIDGKTIQALQNMDGSYMVWEVPADGISEYVGRFDDLDHDAIRVLLDVDPQLRHQHPNYK